MNASCELTACSSSSIAREPPTSDAALPGQMTDRRTSPLRGSVRTRSSMYVCAGSSIISIRSGREPIMPMDAMICVWSSAMPPLSDGCDITRSKCSRASGCNNA